MKFGQVSVILFALLLMTGLVPEATAKKKKRSYPTVEWGLSLAASAHYNDNLFGLSERDANSFLRDAASFPTPLETVDDLETEWTIRPSLRWRAPAKLLVNADYRLKFVHRFENAFTDYQTHSAGLSVRPRATGSPWQLKARVFLLPSFYLRAYNDKDYNEYHAARFANRYYNGSLRYKLHENVWVEPEAGVGTFYYNRKFTEYDSDYHDFGGSAGYRAGDWSASAGYLRRRSENVGKEQLGGQPLVSDPYSDTEYGDADFNEDEFNFSVGGDLTFVTWRPVNMDLGYRWRRRVYTTDRALELDPFHRGRLDRRGQLTATLTTEIDKRLSLDIFSGYDERVVDSPWPSVAAVKNFVRHEYGLRLNCKVH